MNILIVGNGFDLSHYLPTKYDHFMDVMKAIEVKDLGEPIKEVFNNKVEDVPTLLLKVFEIKKAINEKTYEMNFDDLFKKSREKSFIEKTKEIYEINKVKISFEQIVKIQYQLKKNGWYQYFKNHVEKITTWIDFEQKIEEVLVILATSVVKLENTEIDRYDYRQLDVSNLLSQKNINTLNFFGFSENVGGNIRLGTRIQAIPLQTYVNPRFCHGKNIDNGFSATAFLDFLHQELEEFIQIFNSYLELIIDKLSSTCEFAIKTDEWIYPDKIFSFNYTNTYQKNYDSSIDTDYLHGSFGTKQNIVLGISELHDDSLKKIKAYGFTKYHQKLFKDTQYLFLDKFKKKIQQDKKDIEELKRKVMMPLQSAFVKSVQSQLNEKMNSQCLDLNFYIWGHSLDVSDKDYILDLFSLNDDMDRNVRITIYYFDKNAKFTLLNNLLSILDKDKVEQWMKNKWLQFKPNPEIKFDEISSEKTA
ncbi:MULTISPECIES: AbiH family protein [Acinetobacter Taxon 24]|uniref:AbiH family protein n=2 Tax=Acinetobacter Taxon 24 TaxID=2839056 RepID=A0AAW6UX89_9GAMM|nr:MULTISPECIES: AbiH family protein [Acinetobacter Taxon 24]MDK1684469.1 AbiH family protein [Acinetobacter terrestris]NNH38040.1 hypothetical protein [Acinetobacter terrae]